jgi:glycosyltransferase involved in cell wall biosynthesis
MLVSILIPIHNVDIYKINLIKYNLDKIYTQTYQNFEIVICDESDNDLIYFFINLYNNFNKIKYIKSSLKGWSNNHNEGLKHCSGDIIKILHYDNYFYDNNSLQNIVDTFNNNEDKYWIVSPYFHENLNERKDDENKLFNLHTPKYTDNIIVGHNFIGDPSCLSFRNKNVILFDKNLTFMVDCDYYKRLYDLYNLPIILTEPNIVVVRHKNQTSNFCLEINNMKERVYMEFKYKNILKIGDDNPYKGDLKDLYYLEVIKHYQNNLEKYLK